MSGANIIGQAGIYGTKGVPGETNVPGARLGAVSWTDTSGNFWLFGGYGFDSGGTAGDLNDFWKFDGSNWTFVSGASTTNQAGSYGRTPADTNVPGAREAATSWIDRSGNFWLFGGSGYDSAGTTAGDLNDLWKFDGSNWTWVSGASTTNQAGTYGTKGIPEAANVPGARFSASSWIDTSDNLWLFGGSGHDSTGAGVYFNDLWKFDGSYWTFVSGASTTNQAGSYGRTPAAANVPGARFGAVSWIDTSGNFWLFGGGGYDSTGAGGYLNDLWKFDGSYWTFVSGASTTNQAGTYGTKGTPAAANVPGARIGAVSWVDTSGNFWLFGGSGFDSAGATVGDLNDLWKFDGSNWTWVSGSDTADEFGIYSSKNITADTNVPGAREAAVSWIDSSGNLWLFGGNGIDSAGANDVLNDLWGYQP